MEKKENISTGKNNIPESEKLNQEALGNTAIFENGEEDLTSMPKTTGTGSNNASSTPKSLIIHEDKSGEERYEVGEKEDE